MPEPNSGCHFWLGAISSAGYGNFWDGQHFVGAHRYAFEQVNGPLAPGLEPDHKCRIRSCVNPVHLEAVTRKENLKRGDGVRLRIERGHAQTHCKHGHPFSGDNLIKKKNGRRGCRICMRKFSREYQQRKRNSAQQEAISD